MFKPELKDELEKKRSEMMARMGRLKSLRDNPATGWRDFVEIIDQYIAYCRNKKLTTKLDTATPAMLEQLRFMDNYVSALEWIKQIPTQYVKTTEDKIEQLKREAEQPDPVYV